MTERFYGRRPGGAPGQAPRVAVPTGSRAGTPLAPRVRARMESSFGVDFGGVRVLRDQASAPAIGARAYSVGSTIVFGPGAWQPGAPEGERLLAHELAHVVQAAGAPRSARGLTLGSTRAPEERAADRAAAAVMNGGAARVEPSAAGAVVRRAALHSGNILDEGSCEHLACNSKWACDDPSGVLCPDGTKHAGKKMRPLFTCDVKCENNKSCDDHGNWMAIPYSRFASRKCGQDLVVCGNGHSVHASVRDRSVGEYWEVSHGIQDSLGLGSYGSFQGAIYGDESDPAFKTDKRCGG